MDKTEIEELIAGHEEDIEAWQRTIKSYACLLTEVPELIADREQMIAGSRARIAELKQRMETGQWLTQ